MRLEKNSYIPDAMNILNGDGDFLSQLFLVAFDPRQFVHEALVENPVDFRASGQFCSVDF